MKYRIPNKHASSFVVAFYLFVYCVTPSEPSGFFLPVDVLLPNHYNTQRITDSAHIYYNIINDKNNFQ